MVKYKNNSVVTEAVQWNGNNLYEVYTFMGHEVDFKGDWRIQDRFFDLENSMRYNGLEIGKLKASVGDYIVKDAENGEFFPCKPDTFEQTYQKV